jgi:FkbM family methyltransferase
MLKSDRTMMTARMKTFLKRLLPMAQTTLPPASFYRPFADCQVRGLDAIYNAAFGHLRRGVFVEVGAYDGQFVSNTCFLADLGWRGVYVEPIPEFAAACVKRHQRNPDVTVVNSAVGKEPGTTELHLAGALSTGNENFFSAYRNISWAKGLLSHRKVTAPVVTLDGLLDEHKVPNGFELLVVDVEGGEPDVFANFDLARWKPKLLIVELEDRHPDFIEKESIREPIVELRKYILKAGYVEVYTDIVNTVFRALPEAANAVGVAAV